MTKPRSCILCQTDITGSHHNRKFCSQTCCDKARYARDGQRGSPEQRALWRQGRLKTDGYRETVNAQARERNRLVKDFLSRYKLAKGCADCGYNQHHVALDFDHIMGDKKFNVCFSKSIDHAKKEIKKCEVVCSNCHRIRTYSRIYPCKPDIFELTYSPENEPF